MYSPGMPLLFVITACNFTIIYWVDKILLLRFYKTPKNYDEQSIMYSLHEMKFGFLFHFVIGSLVYSNDRILSSSGQSEILTVIIDPISGA